MSRIVVPLLVALVTACSSGEPSEDRAPSSQSTRSESLRSDPRPSKLRIDGTQFLAADSKRFEWRGISAFRLTELIAHGREADAVAFLDWAAAQKLTVVRAFAMAHHLFQLKPSEGLAAVPRLLRLAAARGLHVEVVAFADTAEIEVDFMQHMKALGSIVAAHDNAILEIANEPWHPTQDRFLHSPDNLKKLAALLPQQMLVALGSAERDDGYATGDYVTWHSPRSSGDGGWQHVLDLAEGVARMAKWGKPTVSDEPIGAGPAAIPGRRDNQPGRFGAAAAVTRLAGLGATFHYDGGLQARIPSGVELECFSAWSAALDLLRDLPEGGRFIDGSELSKVATILNARGAMARDYGDEVWLLTVGSRENASVSWAGKWATQTARSSAGVRLFVARRANERSE